jgi:hypothetical protein
VTGLAASTAYDFTVIAVNSAGQSAASTTASATTLIATPGIPGTPTISAIAQSSATVGWSAPVSGGAAATYTVQYRVSGTTTWNQVTGLVALSYSLTGLTASLQYDVQVAAANAGGASAFTSSAQFTTLVAMPGLPTALALGAAGSSSQTLSWSASSSGGAAASFNIRYSPASASNWTTLAGITVTTTTVTGLAAATAYDFEVQAVNAAGTSAWTAAVTGTTAVQGNYLLTPFAPAAGFTAAHGTNGIIAQVNDNSAAGDGGHTVPHAVNVAWATSSTVMPTTGMQSTVPYSNVGHNLWVTYANGPTAGGTWASWGIAYDTSSNIVATCVSPGFVFT